MTTISVPLDKESMHRLDDLLKQGVGSSRADIMRKALKRLAEEEAVRAVLESEKEAADSKLLRGDLRTLLKKMRRS